MSLTQPRNEGEVVLARLRDLVRGRPLVAAAAAGVIGAALGGLVFSRLGRLLFVAAVGYLANELWHSEGRLDIDTLVAGLSRDRADYQAR